MGRKSKSQSVSSDSPRRKSTARGPVGPRPFDSHLEKYNQVAKLGDDVWSICIEHHPGSLAAFPKFNNRCFVLRLKDTSNNDEPTLLAFGIPEAPVFDHIRALESETGLKLKYAVAQGGLHHLYLGDWLKELPDVKVFVPPRVMNIKSAKAHMKAYPGRVTALPDEPFPEFKDQAQFILFKGLGVHEDIPMPAENVDQEKATNDLMAQMDTKTHMLPATMPTEEVFVFLSDSKTMIVGENVAWYYSKGTMPESLGAFTQEETVGLNTALVRPKDWVAVKKGWEAVLACEFKHFVGFHELPGVYVKDSYDKLKAAVEAKNELSGVNPAPEATGCKCIVM